MVIKTWWLGSSSSVPTLSGPYLLPTERLKKPLIPEADLSSLRMTQRAQKLTSHSRIVQTASELHSCLHVPRRGTAGRTVAFRLLPSLFQRLCSPPPSPSYQTDMPVHSTENQQTPSGVSEAGVSTSNSPPAAVRLCCLILRTTV